MLVAGATLTALAGVAGIGMITALVVWSRSTNERLMAETPEDIEASAAQQEASEAGAIATGVIMGAAFLTGVPLLVVAVKRRKDAVRMTALPTRGGLAFTISGRF